LPVNTEDAAERLPTSAWERAIGRAIRSLRYGSVEVQVHDGRVVQVETRERVRFADDRQPEHRRRTTGIEDRTDRTTGGAAPSLEETNE